MVSVGVVMERGVGGETETVWELSKYWHFLHLEDAQRKIKDIKDLKEFCKKSLVLKSIRLHSQKN